MNGEYLALMELKNSKGYQILQALWAHEYAEIMKGLQAVAAKNNESNWRYKAGILKGFDLSVGQLERALTQMQIEHDNLNEPNQAEQTVEELLKNLKETNQNGKQTP